MMAIAIIEEIFIPAVDHGGHRGVFDGAPILFRPRRHFGEISHETIKVTAIKAIYFLAEI